MRKFTLLLSALALGATALKAQTVATFDTLHLSKADTFYVNYTASGTDVGFNDGNAHFPCVYDTSFGGLWSSGFAYSNMTDSVTSGYTNQYAAKTAQGYGGTANYLAAHCSDAVTFEPKIKIILRDSAVNRPVKGFYVTNSTYAFNSMRDGDAFAKKFDSGDYFALTVKGYSGGVLNPSGVGFYLADFRFTDTTKNYIVDSWKWMDLTSLGNVDSLELSLTSSDNGSFGMNTPAYFCIDNFTTTDAPKSSLRINNATVATAKVYPNPAVNVLYIDRQDNSAQQITITGVTGSVLYTGTTTGTHTEVNTSTLSAGVYMLTISGTNATATTRFIKQ